MVNFGVAMKALSAVNQEATKRVGIAAAGTWKHVDSFSQEASKSVGNSAGNAKDWIVKHPGQTAGLVSCVAAAPVAIALAPLALGAAGFTAGGVAAGSAAAAAQATVGNVVAGSAFAVLQSAGAGGAGLAVVNGVVGTAATAVAVGATAPSIVKAAKEGSEHNGTEEMKQDGSIKEETQAQNQQVLSSYNEEESKAKL